MIRVGNNRERNNPSCGIITDVANQEIRVMCNRLGQYLSIELKGTQPLQLCEVQAFEGDSCGKNDSVSVCVCGCVCVEGVSGWVCVFNYKLIRIRE